MGGRFFEKRAASPEGWFFRDRPGRDDGRFYGATEGETTRKQAAPLADVVGVDVLPQPYGLHRPPKQVAEPLEAGGTRFLATEAASAPEVVKPGVRPGVPRSPRFLGTAFPKQADLASDVAAAKDTAVSAGGRAAGWAKTKAKTLWDSARRGASDLGHAVDQGVDKAVQNPTVAALMLGGAGLVGARALGRAGKSLLGALRPRPALQPGIVSRLLGAIRGR